MKPVWIVVAASLLLLALLALTIRGAGITTHLVPSPETVSQKFVSALSAGRYEASRHELSDELRARLTVDELEALDGQLRATYGPYEILPVGEARQDGRRASYQGIIESASGEILRPAFELEQSPDTLLWEITNIQGLLRQVE